MKITHFIIDNVEKSLTVEFSINENITNIVLSFEYLRISSPIDSAKKMKNGQVAIISHKKQVNLVNIERVAKYGYRLIFNDDHSAIYSEAYIHTLAIEHDMRWQAYLDKLKVSGHSREAMIEIKQL